jgi:PH domain
MQNVLLTCGSYPAEKLISCLEMCARRGGFCLPAVGQLTLDHFAPLQSFVCSNSSVSKSDIWKFYSIVNIPAGILGIEEEPLGPTLQGFFMHRNLSHSGIVQKWSAGYFLLKASVLYLFTDSMQKIPSWAVSLPNECQGARRCTDSSRPHCFEILLRSGSIQLAAPDEYVCSEWLQSVVQAASRVFDMDEKPKLLGCTLILTEHHLITLREDFSSPLRRVLHQQPSVIVPTPSPVQLCVNNELPSGGGGDGITRKLSNSTILDTSSEVSSIRSTTTSTSSRGCRSNSTLCSSTPTRQMPLHQRHSKKRNYDETHSHTNMTSLYGKNSGIEILTCASIEELISIKIPCEEDTWWCLLVRERDCWYEI